MASFDPILREVEQRWPKNGEARRLFHGRGHMCPGLEHVTLTAWPPYIQLALFAEEEASWIEGLVDGLVNQVEELEGIVLQERAGRATKSSAVYGDVPETLITLEHGLEYKIQPLKNQNVGLFLDMGHIRKDLTPEFKGARVLNLFAFMRVFGLCLGAWCKFGCQQRHESRITRNRQRQSSAQPS